LIEQEIGVGLFDLLLDYSFREGIRPFKKSSSIEILSIVCANKQLKSDSNFNLNERFIKIRENALKILSKELENEKLKFQYISELLKLFERTEKYFKEVDIENKVWLFTCLLLNYLLINLFQFRLIRVMIIWNYRQNFGLSLVKKERNWIIKFSLKNWFLMKINELINCSKIIALL
jgi:hypothetical protein